MTEERKLEIEEWAKTRSKKQLRESLGMAIHFEMFERAAIIRDVAGETLEPIPWDKYIVDKINKVLYDKRKTNPTKSFRR